MHRRWQDSLLWKEKLTWKLREKLPAWSRQSDEQSVPKGSDSPCDPPHFNPAPFRRSKSTYTSQPCAPTMGPSIEPSTNATYNGPERRTRCSSVYGGEHSVAARSRQRNLERRESQNVQRRVSRTNSLYHSHTAKAGFADATDGSQPETTETERLREVDVHNLRSPRLDSTNIDMEKYADTERRLSRPNMTSRDLVRFSARTKPASISPTPGTNIQDSSPKTRIHRLSLPLNVAVTTNNEGQAGSRTTLFAEKSDGNVISSSTDTTGSAGCRSRRHTQLFDRLMLVIPYNWTIASVILSLLMPKAKARVTISVNRYNAKRSSSNVARPLETAWQTLSLAICSQLREPLIDSRPTSSWTVLKSCGINSLSPSPALDGSRSKETVEVYGGRKFKRSSGFWGV